MNALKLLAAGAAIGVVLVAFRDEEEGWIVPGREFLRDALIDGDAGGGEREPILGYDGMDEETIIDWLDDSGSDRDTLLRMLRYEAGHHGRQHVLSALVDQL
jgi:hypothetical protein